LVVDAKDDLGRLEAAGRWLQLYSRHSAIREYVLNFIVLLLMRSYRKEVFRHLKDLVQPEHHKKAASGNIMLCQTSLEQHLVAEAVRNRHLVDPRRTKIKSIEELVRLLWGCGSEDEMRRDRWENAPFRVLNQRAIEIVEASCGGLSSQAFHDLVKRYFIATHWLIPYPTPTKFVQTSHNNQVLWLGIYHQRLAYSHKYGVAKLPATVLLGTVQARPTTAYRPRHRENRWLASEKTDDAESWAGIPPRCRYMEDWDLVVPQQHPLIKAVPCDMASDWVAFDSSLATISQRLDLVWQAEQQLVEIDSD
jgi:hypothetical protein